MKGSKSKEDKRTKRKKKVVVRGNKEEMGEGKERKE